MTFWHGGYPHLKPGDLILPPSRTGTRPLLAVAAEMGVPTPDTPTATDRVYVTSEPADAALFATWWTDGSEVGGRLYQVEPIGQLRRDPDYQARPCKSFTCPEALVVAAHPDRAYPPHEATQ